MQEYQKVVVAIDVYSEYDAVVKRALAIAGNALKLHLIYVAYPQANLEPYGLFLESDFTEQVVSQAKEKLDSIATTHGIPKSHTEVTLGGPAEEVQAFADRVGADLIVIGTHGQSGLRLLLGSTANAVLHGVKVDVLAVKV